MLIKTREIINLINKKREKIYKYVSNLNTDCVVTLFDDNDNRLTVGIDGIGDDEYGDIVLWDEKVTEASFQWFTIQHINKWLSANRATVETLDKDKETFNFSL